MTLVHYLYQIQNQKELYCQVCLHTQGICLGVRRLPIQKHKHSVINIYLR